MDEKENKVDEIEILDDIEEEILFVEDENEYKTTYAEDTSLTDNENISLGNEEEGHSVNDALTKFSTEENAVAVEPIKEEIEEVKPVAEPIIKNEMSFESDEPSLSDEMDNTMVLAKQAIDPTPIKEEVHNDDTKSNKRALVFIIVLFVVLAALVFALPYIKDLF